MNYEEFREAREDLRTELRLHIARQSLDNSDRGRSVAGAANRMYEMHGITNPDVPFPRGWRRAMWRAAYAAQRCDDRKFRARMDTFAKLWMRRHVEEIVRPRKIDELLGTRKGEA